MSPEPLAPDEIAGPISVTIRRNSDKVVRTLSLDLTWRGPFWWSEGNAGCDCNREWWFADAGGEKRAETTTCGHDGFTVLSITVPGGLVVYREPDMTTAERVALVLRQSGLVAPGADPAGELKAAEAVIALLRDGGAYIPDDLS